MNSGVFKVSEAAAIALHTAVMLAANSEKVLSTGEIASALQVSEAHLSKVLQRLSRVGLVKSIRGPKGGFVLAKSGNNITLEEVYEAIDGRLGTKRCLLKTKVCRGNNCILGELIRSINMQVKDYMTNTKLNDLINVYGSSNNATQENRNDR